MKKKCEGSAIRGAACCPGQVPISLGRHPGFVRCEGQRRRRATLTGAGIIVGRLLLFDKRTWLSILPIST